MATLDPWFEEEPRFDGSNGSPLASWWDDDLGEAAAGGAAQTLALASALVAAQADGVTLSPGASTLALAAALTSSGEGAFSLSPGAQTLALASALAVAAKGAATASPGTVALLTPSARVSAGGGSVGPSGAAVTVQASPARLDGRVGALSVAPAGTSVALAGVAVSAAPGVWILVQAGGSPIVVALAGARVDDLGGALAIASGSSTVQLGPGRASSLPGLATAAPAGVVLEAVGAHVDGRGAPLELGPVTTLALAGALSLAEASGLALFLMFDTRARVGIRALPSSAPSSLAFPYSSSATRAGMLSRSTATLELLSSSSLQPAMRSKQVAA